MFFQTVYFHLWFLCKSDLRIFRLWEMIEKLSAQHFSSQKNDVSSTFLGFKGTVVNQAYCHFCVKSYLKLHLYVPIRGLVSQKSEILRKYMVFYTFYFDEKVTLLHFWYKWPNLHSTLKVVGFEPVQHVLQIHLLVLSSLDYPVFKSTKHVLSTNVACRQDYSTSLYPA